MTFRLSFVPPHFFQFNHEIFPYSFFDTKVHEVQSMFNVANSELSVLAQARNMSWQSRHWTYGNNSRLINCATTPDGQVHLAIQQILHFDSLETLDKLIKEKQTHIDYLSICLQNWLSIRQEADELMLTYKSS